MSDANTILVVDDEPEALLGIELALHAAGFAQVITCADSRRALDLVRDHPVSVVLCDLTMPHRSGEDLLRDVQARHPEIPVVIITGRNEVDTAVRLTRAGAFDYIVKPVGGDRIALTVGRAIEVNRLRQENADLRLRMLSAGIARPEAFAHIRTVNQGMRALFAYCEAIAPSSQPALISGETGSGKELIARAIHTLSERTGEFVAVNVAGLDDQLFSDTLFGHQKGAFTGADGVRAGLVERAAGGTLFLDEISDLPIASQVKLLRLLQEREFYPLGADRPRRADVRVVVAANRDLWSDVCRERFRADLFHRLACHRIDLPPLRARRDDLPVLLDHFIAEAASDLRVKAPTPAKEILHLLGAYQFPGNIRELRAMVFDAVAGHKGGPLGAAVFKTHITRTGWAIPDEPPTAFPFPERLPTLKELDALAVGEALRRAQGNQSVAAMMLGISQQALSKRLAKDDDNSGE